MATIGTFKKSGTEYTGEIVTLNVQARGADEVALGGRAGQRQRQRPGPHLDPCRRFLVKS